MDKIVVFLSTSSDIALPLLLERTRLPQMGYAQTQLTSIGVLHGLTPLSYRHL